MWYKVFFVSAIKKYSYISIMLWSIFFSFWLDKLGYNSIVNFIIVLGSTLILITWLEFIIPYRKNWQYNFKDSNYFEFKYFLYYWFLMLLLFEGTTHITEHFVTNFAFPKIVYPGMVFQFFAVLILLEFMFYWIHRFGHTTRWGFKLHKFHHSPTEMHAFNDSIENPTFQAIFVIITAVILVLLNFDNTISLVILNLRAAHGLLHHANIDYDNHPIIDVVFNSPRVHRWHHTIATDVPYGNYSAILLIFDHVFGTYANPRKFDTEVGIAGIKPVRKFSETILLEPFSNK